MIFSFHKTISAVCAITALLYHLIAKPQLSILCMVSSCLTLMIVSLYTVIEETRTGERPTWPIDYDADVKGIVAGFLLLYFAFSLSEACGKWSPILGERRWPVACGILVWGLRVTSQQKQFWAAGLEMGGWFIFHATISDEKYQEACRNGTDIWTSDLLSGLVRGRLPGMVRQVNEERRRQEEMSEESGEKDGGIAHNEVSLQRQAEKASEGV